METFNNEDLDIIENTSEYSENMQTKSNLDNENSDNFNSIHKKFHSRYKSVFES